MLYRCGGGDTNRSHLEGFYIYKTFRGICSCNTPAGCAVLGGGWGCEQTQLLRGTAALTVLQIVLPTSASSSGRKTVLCIFENWHCREAVYKYNDGEKHVKHQNDTHQQHEMARPGRSIHAT